MKSHVLFKALVLGSVFSASLSHSALTLGGQDFDSVGLRQEYDGASDSVRKKLEADDLDRGLAAAKTIDTITKDEGAATSKAYLKDVLKALDSQNSGDVEKQDEKGIKGFGKQIDKLFGFLQSASRLQQTLDNPSDPLSTEVTTQLQDALKFISDNLESVLNARKDMAKVFWTRRIGHNSQHRDAFENAWGAFVRYKKLDLIIQTLESLSQDPEMRRVFGITEQTKPEEFTLSLSLLGKLPSYLLAGITEFADDLFSADEIFALKEKYPDLKKVLHFKETGKAFTTSQIELLKRMYPMLKSVPEFSEKRFTFAQILALRTKYSVPYMTYWAGDNEDYSTSGAAIKRGAAKALDAMGMAVPADQIRYEKMSLALRQLFSLEIQRRGLETPPKDVEQKIDILLEKAKRLWVQHHLGKKSLEEGEAFPEKEKFSRFLHALQTQAHLQYVLDGNIPFNFEDIFAPYRAIYESATKGSEEAFQEVCSWTELVDDNDPLFETGDHGFYDEYDGANANPDEKNRFSRILRGIWTKLARQKLAEHGLDQEAVLVHQKSLETRLRECDPSKLDEEKVGHPGHWIAERLKTPTGEVIQGFLHENAKQMRIIEKIWFDTRGSHITYLPPEETSPGIEAYDHALELLITPEKLQEEERLKLNQITSGTHPSESVLRVADQQSAIVRLYSFMMEVEEIVRAVENQTKRTKDDPAEVFMNTIANNYPHLLQNLAVMVTSRVELAQKLGTSYPHLSQQIERLSSVWNKYQGLNPTQAKSQYMAIYSEFKKLSSYALRRDMRKSTDLFRQWFDRKSSRAEGYDHILMLRQFISTAQNESLERGLRENLLRRIWTSNTYRPKIEDYLR